MLFSKFVADIRVQAKKSDFETLKISQDTNFWILDTNILADCSRNKEGKMFKLVSKYEPAGDQPKAIEELVKGIEEGKKHQVLLGATGTGKTFTIANVIARTNKPTLVLAHNKTLAGQLYAELKEIFPENHVCYFVSYYSDTPKTLIFSAI